MDAFPTVDACRRLHRAGWSLGEHAAAGPGGAERWHVWGTNGENAIDATADTQAGAWHDACRQAEALGMLRR